MNILIIYTKKAPEKYYSRCISNVVSYCAFSLFGHIWDYIMGWFTKPGIEACCDICNKSHVFSDRCLWFQMQNAFVNTLLATREERFGLWSLLGHLSTSNRWFTDLMNWWEFDVGDTREIPYLIKSFWHPYPREVNSSFSFCENSYIFREYIFRILHTYTPGELTIHGNHIN